MITFRLTKTELGIHSFIIPKRSNVQLANNYFGFITDFRNGNFVVRWYKNYTANGCTYHDEIVALSSFKTIKPYFDNGIITGEVWKDSYPSLIANLAVGNGFSNITGNPVCFRKKVYVGDEVEVTSARVVLDYKLDELIGKVIANDQHIRWTIQLNSGRHITINRSAFRLVPQDEYALIEIICPYCLK